ncbi:MAG: hypothetical protein OXD32_06535 [Endozoicomonadaceae bacterium]|nr:hypothetical protein [Endozoicomonadaceae bacterium]
MENADTLIKQKPLSALSEVTSGLSSFKLSTSGQFACRSVAAATAGLKIYRVAAEIYSDEAKYNFHEAFKPVNSREVTETTHPSLLSSPLMPEREWKTSGVINNLLDIYTTFTDAFFDGDKKTEVTKRLYSFLQELDKSEDYDNLFNKHFKSITSKNLRVICSFHIQDAKNYFCKQHIVFFCGLLALLIELKQHLNNFEFSTILPLHFFADFLLATSLNGGIKFFLNKQTMTQYLKIIDKKQSALLFIEHLNRLKLSYLYLLINDLYWSKVHSHRTDTVINPQQKNDWQRYFYGFIAPQYLCNILSDCTSVYDQSYYDELTDSPPSATVLFNSEQIKFGEEFEFSFEYKPGHKYSANDLVTKWHQFISDKMAAMHIPLKKYTCTKSSGLYGKELFL